MSGIYLGPTTNFDTERSGIYPAVPENGGDFSLAARKKIRTWDRITGGTRKVGRRLRGNSRNACDQKKIRQDLHD